MGTSPPDSSNFSSKKASVAATAVSLTLHSAGNTEASSITVFLIK